MPYRAILFDLDGTLIDTLQDISNAANRVLSTQGFPTHPLDIYRGLIGEGTVSLITRVLPQEKRNPDTIQTCLQAYWDDYGQNWNVKTKPFAGIPAMLNALVARELKLAVLSNKPEEFTQECVSGLLPNWTFDAVIGTSERVPSKPSPLGALEIAVRLSIPPEEFLYLGDTGVDMRTAIAARMFAVGVLWGFRGREELQREGSRVLIEQPMEILRLLD
jgi:phosphoglycolate phosphatase